MRVSRCSPSGPRSQHRYDNRGDHYEAAALRSRNVRSHRGRGRSSSCRAFLALLRDSWVGPRQVLVERELHEVASWRSRCAANSMAAQTFSGVSSERSSTTSSVVIPAARYSSTSWTAMRVPASPHEHRDHHPRRLQQPTGHPPFEWRRPNGHLESPRPARSGTPVRWPASARRRCGTAGCRG